MAGPARLPVHLLKSRHLADIAGGAVRAKTATLRAGSRNKRGRHQAASRTDCCDSRRLIESPALTTVQMLSGFARRGGLVRYRADEARRSARLDARRSLRAPRLGWHANKHPVANCAKRPLVSELPAGWELGGKSTSRGSRTQICVRLFFCRDRSCRVAGAYSQPGYCGRPRPASREAGPWSLEVLA